MCIPLTMSIPINTRIFSLCQKILLIAEKKYINLLCWTSLQIIGSKLNLFCTPSPGGGGSKIKIILSEIIGKTINMIAENREYLFVFDEINIFL